jgi:hypothetical protein
VRIMDDKYLDCVVIGYNELPFERYENFLRNYGEDSEAYRDLRRPSTLSFLIIPRVVATLRFNPGLELANAFGVESILKLNKYLESVLLSPGRYFQLPPL